MTFSRALPFGFWDILICMFGVMCYTLSSRQKVMDWGAWVSQWVKASAFGSGHDPRVLGLSPASGSLLSREPASSSLSACLSAYL